MNENNFQKIITILESISNNGDFLKIGVIGEGFRDSRLLVHKLYEELNPKSLFEIEGDGYDLNIAKTCLRSNKLFLKAFKPLPSLRHAGLDVLIISCQDYKNEVISNLISPMNCIKIFV